MTKTESLIEFDSGFIEVIVVHVIAAFEISHINSPSFWHTRCIDAVVLAFIEVAEEAVA